MISSPEIQQDKPLGINKNQAWAVFWGSGRWVEVFKESMSTFIVWKISFEPAAEFVKPPSIDDFIVVAEPGDVCPSLGHLKKNCPAAVCRYCNKGHDIKCCPVCLKDDYCLLWVLPLSLQLAFRTDFYIAELPFPRKHACWNVLQLWAVASFVSTGHVKDWFLKTPDGRAYGAFHSITAKQEHLCITDPDRRSG